MNWRKFFGPAASGVTRREAFGAGILATLLGRTAATAAPSRYAADNIYSRLLGVKPLLTCRGHTTAFGGSLMPTEVLRAMAEANDYFVDMDELNIAAGKRIAEVMGAEAAMVSAGSFSAMLLGAAACLTGTDQNKMAALPHPDWPRRECLIPKGHRVLYDRAYKAAGMTIIEVDGLDQLRNAIGEKTAMLAGLGSTDRSNPKGAVTVKQLVEVGRQARVPVLIDAASELPPVSSLRHYVATGADLVVISGGKGLLGPQSTGILAGRRELVEAARLNHSPYAHIGRGMKVGKEEIVGLVAAVNRYASLDHDMVHETWNKKARWMAEQLQDIKGVTAVYRINAYGFGEVRITWDRKVIPLTGHQAFEKLMAGEPRVLFYQDEEGGTFQTRSMKDGDEILAARRLRQFFVHEAPRG
ncbi:MAG: aminotransferase class V-fold PLP-dependent enzyme [Bryobacterales bacterium]|nr:aminotransferase class V-fold PLP-dependent enzyme [Bryobacterales bacterium]